MWIGPDIAFAPKDVDRLRAHSVPIACALYAQPGRRELNCRPLPDTSHLLFGTAGGLQEVEHAGCGILLIRRPVLMEVQRRFGLPFCDEVSAQLVIPFFLPVIGPHEDGYRWLESDFGLCDFARQCGFRVLADTTVRLWTFGVHGQSWEDIGAEPPRYANYNLAIG